MRTKLLLASLGVAVAALAVATSPLGSFTGTVGQSDPQSPPSFTPSPASIGGIPSALQKTQRVPARVDALTAFPVEETCNGSNYLAKCNVIDNQPADSTDKWGNKYFCWYGFSYYDLVRNAIWPVQPNPSHDWLIYKTPIHFEGSHKYLLTASVGRGRDVDTIPRAYYLGAGATVADMTMTIGRRTTPEGGENWITDSVEFVIEQDADLYFGTEALHTVGNLEFKSWKFEDLGQVGGMSTNADFPFMADKNTTPLTDYLVVDNEPKSETDEWGNVKNIPFTRSAYDILCKYAPKNIEGVESTNDWIIYQKHDFLFEKGHKYRINSKRMRGNPWWEVEKNMPIDFYLGDAPTEAGMTKMVAHTQFTDADGEEYYLLDTTEFVYTDPTARKYVGLNFPMKAGNMDVYYWQIEDLGSMSSPAQCQNVYAEADWTAMTNEVTIDGDCPTLCTDDSELTKLNKVEVLRDGEVVQTLTDGVAPGAHFVIKDVCPAPGTYKYSVRACGDAVGALSPGTPIEVVVGRKGTAVPYFNSIGTQEDFNALTKIEKNKDGYWQFYFDQSCAVIANLKNFGLTNSWTDSYMITPSIHLSANKVYEAGALFWANKEKGEIFMAERPTERGMVNADEHIQVMPFGYIDDIPYWNREGAEPRIKAGERPADKLSKRALKKGRFINVPERNMYLVAHTATGSADTTDVRYDWVRLADMFVKEIADLNGPAKVENLVFGTANADSKDISITFTAPSLTMGGEALTELTRIDVALNGTVVKTFEAPKPGDDLSFTATSTANEAVEAYTVTAYCAGGKGETAECNVYVGRNAALADVTGVHATLADKAVTVAWQPVSTNVYGNPADGITYDVVEVTYGFETGKSPNYAMNVARRTIATGLSDCTFTYTPSAYEEGDQKDLHYMVQAVNQYGRSAAVSTDNNLIVGDAYVTPYVESFADGVARHLLSSEDQSGNMNGQGKTETDENFGASSLAAQGCTSQDGDNGKVWYQAYGFGTRFAFGYIDLSGLDKPEFSGYVFNAIGDDQNDKFILQVDAGQGWQNVASWRVNQVQPTKGWGKFTADLSAYKGQTVRLGMRVGDHIRYSGLPFDHFFIGEPAEKDLNVLGLNCLGDRLEPGDDAMLSLRLSNEGSKDIAAYSVNLYRDGELVKTFARTDLKAGTSTSIELEDAISPLAGSEVRYYAEAVSEEESANCEANNRSNICIIPLNASQIPEPENLTGTYEDSSISVSLAWDKPDNSAMPNKPITDGFEAYQGAQTKTAGEWTLVDGDKNETGIISLDDGTGAKPVAFPGITDLDRVGFFTEDVNGSWNPSFFTAHSGKMVIMSLANAYGYDRADWAMSPELDGTAQTISFWMRAADASFQEEVKVYYSDGSVEPDAMQYVGTTGMADAGWKKFSFFLPEGAKRLGLCSTNATGLLCTIDDVTFQPANGEKQDLAVTGYNVYRDEKLLTATPVNAMEYVDKSQMLKGVHEYAVTAVTGEGESRPARVSVEALSGIGNILDSSDMQEMARYNAAGQQVGAQYQGVVLVKYADGHVEKVIVK